MITLDPEFLGNLVSPGKLTEGMDPTTIPFACRPRLERLRVQGKADVTEDVSEADVMMDDAEVTAVARERDHAEREKRKMRGKGKSLKRYLRKKRKNVIDPRSISVREHLVKQRAERERARETTGYKSKSELPSALDRFYRR